MIIKEIHIDGFGIFHDFSLKNLDNGVNILLGENEAGKSTLLRFVRFTLFGYPRLLQERMLPLQGGTHGGRIRSVLSSGKEVLFEQGGNDKIRLLYDGQELTSVSQWSQLLGNASGDLYNNVYAFTLDELVSMTSIHNSKMEDKIFSLGLGLGNISLAEIERSVAADMNDIYTSRGKVQEVPILLREIDELRSRLRKMQDQLPRYRQLARDIGQLEQQVKEISVRLRNAETEHATIQMYLKCYESFVSLQRVEADLRSLASWQPWPEGGPAKMEQILMQKQQLSQRLSSLSDGTNGEKGIKELEEAMSKFQINDNLLQQENEVEYLRLNLTSYRQNLSEREEERARLHELDNRIAETIAFKISTRWTEQNVLEFREHSRRQGQLQLFEDMLRETREKKRDWEAQEKALAGQKGSFNTKLIAILLSVVFIIGSVPFFFTGVPVGGAAMIAVALVVFLGRKAFERKNHLQPVREKIGALAEEEMRIIRDFNHWLEHELKLPTGLTFLATGQILQSISSLKEDIAHRNKLRQKIQEQRLPFIQNFQDRVNMLREYHPERNEEPLVMAQRIIREFDENRKLRNSLSALQDELERKKKEKKQVEHQLSESEMTLAQLLSSVGADSPEQYFELYRQNGKVAELQNTRKALVEKIETIAGFNKLDEVVEYLKEHDKQILELKLQELNTSLELQKGEKDRLNKEIGSAIAEKQAIAGESDLAVVLTQLEVHRQLLRDAWKKWLSGQLALQVLSKVKNRFEQEKQPEVIRKASGYFNSINSGRYSGLRTSLEGREVTVFDQREVSKTPEQLSRGTREQLLVSLRMGFIEEYETQAEPLPVIVDEVLVNFDPTRARKTAQILTQFAQQRQLLLFTCHPSTIDLFDREKVNVLKLG